MLLRVLLIFIVIVSIYIIGVFFRYSFQKKNYLEFWDKKAKENGELLYIALGDSTVTGVGASNPTKTYVWQIKERYEERTGKTVRVVNLGYPGAKTEDLIRDQLPQLSNYKNPDLVTVSIGANDTNHKTEKNDVLSNLKTIVLALPKGSFLAEIPPLRGKDSAEILQINTSLKLFASKEGINIVLLFGALEKVTNDLSIYDYDFFHPNDKGYKIWANTFWSTINK